MAEAAIALPRKVSRLERALSQVGLERVAERGMAYLYVVSETDDRTKIGCTGDMAGRAYELFSGPALRIHAAFLMSRADVLRCEVAAKGIGDCIRNKWNGAPTDWYSIAPEETVNVAKRAMAEVGVEPVRSFFFPDFSVSKMKLNRGTCENRLSIRLPPGMKERMVQAARADSRNLTSWIEEIIRDALDASEKKRHR